MLRPALAFVLSITLMDAHALGIGDLVRGIAGLPGDPGLSVDHVLARISEIENRKLPQMVDQETRLDQVAAGPGQQLTYRYTILNRRSIEENRTRFNSLIEPTLKDRACSEKSLKRFFKNGVKVSWEYRAQDGHNIGKIHIFPSDCGYQA